MFVDILFVVFISAFISIVVLGHVVLFTTIWPDVFRKWPAPHLDAVDDGATLIH